MLNIAREIEIRRGARIYRAIVTDLGNYPYPLLQIQAHRSFPVFSRYVLDLARLGLWKNKMFHAYFLALLLLGPNKVDRLVAFIKKRRGNTPILGKIYEGQSV